MLTRSPRPQNTRPSAASLHALDWLNAFLAALLLGFGLWRMAFGDLPRAGHAEGMLQFGEKGDGLLLGASLFVVLHAFASGGAAVTGVEAISNGVPAFRKPEWRNARQTLVVMGSGLAVMFLGLSFLASKVEVAPFEDGTPTVLAQIGEAVYGHGSAGEAMSSILNIATMLILVLGDSLSAAYGIDVRKGRVALLQQRLEREAYPHGVVNASVSPSHER